MIESNSLVFRFQKHQLPGSSIIADYVLTDSSTVFFVDDGKPISVFIARMDQLQNVYRSIKLTTLKIDREDIFTGAVETLYVSNSYVDRD